MSVPKFRPVRITARQDYAEWCESQARALRECRWDGLDVTDLADELEAMSRAERRSLESALAIVLLHLLKEMYQPKRRTKSWGYSVTEHARRVVRLVGESPSLKSQSGWDESLVEAYDTARLRAASETGLDLESFPPSLTADVNRLLDEALRVADEHSRARSQERKTER